MGGRQLLHKSTSPHTYSALRRWPQKFMFLVVNGVCRCRVKQNKDLNENSFCGLNNFLSVILIRGLTIFCSLW